MRKANFLLAFGCNGMVNMLSFASQLRIMRNGIASMQEARVPDLLTTTKSRKDGKISFASFAVQSAIAAAIPKLYISGVVWRGAVTAKN